MQVSVFLKDQLLARGTVAQVSPLIREVQPVQRSSDLLAFDDETGKQVDFDFRAEAEPELRRPGRPALGVAAKEVTLLPRHWEWLSRQRGGASATLRKLVEEELRRGRKPRDCHDAAYQFLRVMAGELPKFEDAVRELYLDNRIGYDHFSHGWPADIRDHGRRLGWPK